MIERTHAAELNKSKNIEAVVTAKVAGLFLQSTCDFCISVNGGTPYWLRSWTGRHSTTAPFLRLLGRSLLIHQKKRKRSPSKTSKHSFLSQRPLLCRRPHRHNLQASQVEQYRQGSNHIDLSALLGPATYYVAIIVIRIRIANHHARRKQQPEATACRQR